ncbi:hypothetical protein CAL7716_065380 [Calothrix sp. PCC 7716]|nr:hypothetical protein CAL7716_065380 [Calothrix sp. PCC 7716]
MKFPRTSRFDDCPICGRKKPDCGWKPDDPNFRFCMNTHDAYSTPPGWKFVGLTSGGQWGMFVPDTTREYTEAERIAYKERWQQLQVERRKQHAESLDERERHYQHRKLIDQLSLHSRHREDLQRRGLSDELIRAGLFRSIDQYQKLDFEVSYRLAGVGITGKSLTNFTTGYMVPVWNEYFQIVGYQIRNDNPGDDNPKYFWASSKSNKKNTGASVHLQNGELPLTFCVPVRIARLKSNNENLSKNFSGSAELLQNPGLLAENHESEKLRLRYIMLAEGILKPWILSQIRDCLCIGAAGGNFAASPQTLKRYLEAASVMLAGSKQVVLWADAGAVSNKQVMRQYKKTYQLLKKWGYELQVAWWGQVDKSHPDPDEYAGKYELLTWNQFESLSRNPLQFWDSVKQQLSKLSNVFKQKRGVGFKPNGDKKQVIVNELNYIPGQLPNYDEYLELGCPKIIYQASERFTLWQEATDKGWKNILDKSLPGLGKSYTAGSLKASEFDSIKQLFYLASDHRNPTTLTVEKNFVDLIPRHNGLELDKTRTTPLGKPYLVRPTDGVDESKLTKSNCFREHMFRVLAAKNIHNIESHDNPICGGCHLNHACPHNIGDGFGFRFLRTETLKHPQVRAHPDSLPMIEDYRYDQCGLIWDEVSQLMRVRTKIEVRLDDFKQTVGELALTASETYDKLKQVLLQLEDLFASNNSLKFPRYGFGDAQVREIIGELPDNLYDIISNLLEVLTPNLSFVAEKADSISTSVGTKQDKARDRKINKLLRGDNYKEVKQQLNLVGLNWLAPFLEVLGNYVDGSLAFNKGVLTIHLADYRHRDVARAAKFNIYLDGTMDVRHLALKLHSDVEDILVVEQAVPSYDNLTIVHVTGMGTLGKDRRKQSMLPRVLACRDGIINSHPGKKASFIERKVHALDGDGYHFRDGRGVNRFLDTQVLTSLGVPYSHIGEMAAEYQILTGKQVDLNVHANNQFSQINFENADTALSEDIDNVVTEVVEEVDDIVAKLFNKKNDADNNQLLSFQEFIDGMVCAEILQESGRLRSHLRLNEELVYYFVGDFDISFVKDELPGCKFVKKPVIEIAVEAASYGEQTQYAIIKSLGEYILKGKHDVRQPDVMVTMAEPVSQGRISQIVKELKYEGGWRQLRQAAIDLIASLTARNRGKPIDLDDDLEWLRNIYLPLIGEEPPSEMIANLLGAVGVVGIKFRDVLVNTNIEVKTQLLTVVFAVIAKITGGLEWLVEDLKFGFDDTG